MIERERERERGVRLGNKKNLAAFLEEIISKLIRKEWLLPPDTGARARAHTHTHLYIHTDIHRPTDNGSFCFFPNNPSLCCLIFHGMIHRLNKREEEDAFPFLLCHEVQTASSALHRFATSSREILLCHQDNSHFIFNPCSLCSFPLHSGSSALSVCKHGLAC